MQAELIQFRQLFLPHCHILKLTAVRQHGQELQPNATAIIHLLAQTTKDVTVGFLTVHVIPFACKTSVCNSCAKTTKFIAAQTLSLGDR